MSILPTTPRSPLASSPAAMLLCVALAGLAVTVVIEADEGWADDADGSPISTLSANTLLLDVDCDGLVDAQGLLAGTSPLDFDTDADGFGDGEELARHSDPLNPLSFPMGDGVSATLLARGEGGDAAPRGRSPRAPGTLERLDGPNRRSRPRSDRLRPARPVPRARGRPRRGRHGRLERHDDRPAHRSELRPCLRRDGHVLPRRRSDGHDDPQHRGEGRHPLGGGRAGVAAPDPVDPGSTQLGGHRRWAPPADPSSTPPPPSSGWVSGAICYQRSEVVGINGPRILHQIVEADCH